MTHSWTVLQVDETGLNRLAQLIALKLTAGDVLALWGDLGAGKTTLARACLRALLSDASAEVPSPTFSIVQTYDTPRLFVAHVDFYRLNSGEEVEEYLISKGLVKKVEIEDGVPLNAGCPGHGPQDTPIRTK